MPDILPPLKKRKHSLYYVTSISGKDDMVQAVVRFPEEAVRWRALMLALQKHGRTRLNNGRGAYLNFVDRHSDTVIDPTLGSYYTKLYTENLAIVQRAWNGEGVLADFELWEWDPTISGFRTVRGVLTS